jgi:hypothetical protein
MFLTGAANHGNQGAAASRPPFQSHGGSKAAAPCFFLKDFGEAPVFPS